MQVDICPRAALSHFVQNIWNCRLGNRQASKQAICSMHQFVGWDTLIAVAHVWPWLADAYHAWACSNIMLWKTQEIGCVQNIWNWRFCKSIVAQDSLYDCDSPCLGQRYALIEQWTWAFHVNICISIYMCVSMISYLMLIQASLRSTCCITKIAEKHRTFMFHWNFQICCYFLWCAWMISVLVPF